MSDYPKVRSSDLMSTLTKREYFAAIALQGILAGAKGGDPETAADSLADAAVVLADALIANLNRTPEN